MKVCTVPYHTTHEPLGDNAVVMRARRDVVVDDDDTNTRPAYEGLGDRVRKRDGGSSPCEKV
jgi:hypothetical protein